MRILIIAVLLLVCAAPANPQAANPKLEFYKAWAELCELTKQEDELFLKIRESAITDRPEYVKSVDRIGWLKEIEAITPKRAALIRRLREIEQK